MWQVEWFRPSLPGCRADIADFAQQTYELLIHRRCMTLRRSRLPGSYGPKSSPGRIDLAGPVMRGADVQSQLLGRRNDGAGPVQNGIRVILVRLAALVLRPDPCSVRPLLAGTPVDTELLSRLGDSSQPRHGGQEILSLRTGTRLLLTLHGSPRQRRRFFRQRRFFLKERFF